MSNLISSEEVNGVQLFAGSFPRVTKAITILASVGALVIGTLLGKITKGAVSSAAKSGGNTGNGTLTVDATTPKLANSKAGVYPVRCITADTNGGTFRVTDPFGNVLGDVAVGSTFENQIKFAIADGSTDFIVGDGFDVTIAAGSGKYKPYDDAAVDGAEVAELVLAEALASSASDQYTTAYQSGHFNSAALTGLDAAARVDFAGTPIFIGTVV